MLFERTALSRKPDQLIAQELTTLREDDRLTPDLVFRDPYLLDFLGLKDTYAEKDLESAILREMEAFILEIGVGIADRSDPLRGQEGRDRAPSRSGIGRHQSRFLLDGCPAA